MFFGSKPSLRSIRCVLTCLSIVSFAICFSTNAVIRDGGIDPANLGKGDWVYSIKDCTNQLRGRVAAVTNENSLMLYYKSQGIRYFIMKIGTGSTNYTGCYASPNQLTTNLCNIAHSNGIMVFGYTRSYGADMVGESALADYNFHCGADGFVFDAEAEWETGHAWITNGPAQAWTMLSMVRSNWPNKFLAHAPFPIIYLHSTFPYKEFGYWCDAVMPQIYHFSAAGLKGSPSACINWSDVNWRRWQSETAALPATNINGITVYWTNAIKPILPLQDVYGEITTFSGACNGTANPFSNEDVREFIDYSTADPNCQTVGGYKGINFWRTDLQGLTQWSYIGAGTYGDFPGVVNNIPIDDARGTIVGSWTHVLTFNVTNQNPPGFVGNGSGVDTNSFGTNYFSKTQGTGAAYFQFTPNIVVDAQYDVYEWHVYRTDASAAVPFRIGRYESGGTFTNITTNTVNQTINPGTWNLVGRYSFSAGTNGTVGTNGVVRIMDNFPEGGAVAIADGLKLVFVPFTNAPSAPASVAATAISTSQINLNWSDTPTNEINYLLYRGTVNGGPYSLLATLPSGRTNYSDTNLSIATTYYYVVRGTNNIGASANSSQASATTLGSDPNIVTPPQSQSKNAGQTATFTVVAGGTSPFGYQWKKNGNTLNNGGNASGATTSALTLSNVTQSDAASYTVVVTNTSGSITSSVATLTVVDPPGVTTQPSSRTNIAGTIASFTVVATGTTPNYQWRKNGTDLSNNGNVSGATSASLTLSSVAQSDVASYSVVISNSAGSVTSTVATLTVIDPPNITAQPQGKTVSPGSNVTFTVTATGTAPLSYQWRYNTAPISGATTSSYTRTNAQFADAGSYSVVITNDGGSATSANAVLAIIGSQPVITLENIWNIQAGSRNYVTTGNTERGIAINKITGHVLVASRSAALAGSLGVFILNADTGVELGQMDVSTINNTATFKLNKIGVAEDGVIYGVNLTTASGTSPLFIYRWAIESSVPTQAYSGAPDGGVTARWGDAVSVHGGGTNTQIIVAGSSSTTAVIFTTTDGTNFSANVITPSPAIPAGGFARGLCFGETNSFYVKNRNITTGTNFSYNVAGNSAMASFNIPGLDTNMIAITVATNYHLLFGVLDDNTPTVANHSLKAYDISAPSSPVLVSNFTYLANSSGTSSNNPNIAGAVDTDGDRTVGLDTQNGIVAVRVVLTYPPLIAAQPQSRTNTVGQDATFTVNATGSAPLNYQWRFNGEDISGATGTVYTRTNVQLVHAGSYSVVVSNAAGAVTSSNAILTVDIITIHPTITSQPQSLTVTQGNNATLTVSADGTPAPTFQWKFNNVDISGATGTSYTRTNAQAGNAGSYSVVASNIAGTAPSSNAILTVKIPPSISAHPQSQIAAVGSNITFSVTASGDAPLGYQWRFNGSNISGATTTNYQVTSVQLSNAGSYSVLVTNPVGSLLSADALLTVVGAVIRFDSITMLPDKRFKVRGSGSAGNYLIEVTTNLENWDSGTTVPNTNGLFEWIDPTTNRYQRYYRARLVP